MRILGRIGMLAVGGMCLVGCALQAPPPGETHLLAGAPIAGAIPPPVKLLPLPPIPKPAPRLERYSVVVTNVPVRDLLFALARDAKLNVDVHPAIEGHVTLNAINQTLQQILGRISKQVDIRYDMEDGTLVIRPDTPYLKQYPIDYVNLTRTAKGEVSIATAIAGTGGSVASGNGGGLANNSSTSLSSTSENQFWKTLTDNVTALLREEDRLIVVSRAVSTSATDSGRQGNAVVSPSTNGASASPVTVPSNQEVSVNERQVSVITNPEAGMLMVRATARQHAKVQRFLDQVMVNAHRQVLIEATIVEVLLSNRYQAGVDWSRLVSNSNGLSFSQSLLGGTTLASGPVTTLSYANTDTSLFSGQFSATLKLLETFGKTKVLSSPKVMALNNQTALLKVVDEKVYFTVTLDESRNDKGDVTDRKFTSALHTVPVGMVMSVTPQISEDDQVSLNIRPTISRVTGYKADPVPQLMKADFQNLVPEIQVRELESVLKVPNGQVAVLGGLMQDSVEQQRDGVPLLGRLPVVGRLFSARDDTVTKSELVIFLRPVVVRSASLNGDLAAYKGLQPGVNFFGEDVRTGEVRPDLTGGSL